MPQQLFDERRPQINKQKWDSTSTVGGWGTSIFDTQRDWRIDRLYFSNSDTIPHTIGIDPTNSGGDGALGYVTIPAGAGYGGVEPLELFTTWFDASAQFWLIEEGQPWNLDLGEAITAGKAVIMVAKGGEY